MNKSARDIIRENMRPLLSKEENELIEMMEQYAAQQVQQVREDHKAIIAHEQAVSDEAARRLAEVTKQRDELKEKALDILPRLAEGCRESYYFHGIKEIDQAYDLIEQLENEKKDGNRNA